MLRSVTHDRPAGARTPPGPAPEVASDAGQAPDPRAAVMARPRRGTLRRRQTTQGVSFTVQFSYRGEEHYVYLGGSWDGWTEQRAVEEQGYLMAKVNRGEWTPAPREPLPAPAGAAPSFQLLASEWLHRHQLKSGDPDGRSKTSRDLRWRLSVVIDKFGPVPADRVDYALADELVTELCEERLAIERASELGAPLMRTQVNPRSGRPYRARRRGLSNTSIRRALDAAERVLRDAKKRGVITGELPDLKSAAPRAERPRRSFLELEQVDALLRAATLAEAAQRGLTWEKVAHIRSSDASAVALARELGVSDTLIGKVRRRELWHERAEPRNRHDVPRRIVVETLILAGPRISEFCGLSAHHLDLAGGRLRIPRDATRPTPASAKSRSCPSCASTSPTTASTSLRPAASPPSRPATVRARIPTTCAPASSRRCARTPISCSTLTAASRSRT
jgi:integrase